jgi:hypothetical protein
MRMRAAAPEFLDQNRIRWEPPDRLPMQTIERSSGSGALLLGLALPPGVLAVADLRGLLARGDAGGVLLFALLLLVFAFGTLWGAHLLWYRKTIVIDASSVRIDVRTLRGTAARAVPLREYRAIATLETREYLGKQSVLVLLAADGRASVPLASVPAGSSALPALREHFAKLLRVPQSVAGM